MSGFLPESAATNAVSNHFLRQDHLLLQQRRQKKFTEPLRSQIAADDKFTRISEIEVGWQSRCRFVSAVVQQNVGVK